MSLNNLPEDHINYLNHYKQMDKNNKSPEKREFTSKEKLIAVMSGLVLLLVVGGGLAINKYSPKNQPVETEVPTVPAEITPVATQEIDTTAESSAEKLPTVEDIEITDLQLINNPEKLVEAYDEKLVTEWMNVGATAENAKLASENWYKGTPKEDFAKQVASKYDDLYIEALISKENDNKQWSPDLKNWVERMKDIHANTLLIYFLTSDLNGIHPEDKEPYKRGVKIDEILETRDFSTVDKNNLEEGDKTEIKVRQHDYDNADKNRVSASEWDGGVTSEDNFPTKRFIIEINKNGQKTIKMYDLVTN